jgi:hypothetical protein
MLFKCALLGCTDDVHPPCVPTLPAIERQNEAYFVRTKPALDQFLRGVPERPTNGDLQLYPQRIASFSKALPHENQVGAEGVVDETAFQTLLFAVQTQDPSDFDGIPMGANPSVKVLNPQAAFAFNLEGADSFALAMPPAPKFVSAQLASETVEVYNMALMRDVTWGNYNTSPLTANAVTHLNACSDFRGPKIAGQVTPATLFRGILSGSLNGPFISQFLFQPFNYGNLPIVQQNRFPAIDSDYLTTFSEWLDSQNGVPVAPVISPNLRYICNGRDLAEYCHLDAVYQAHLNTVLYLLGINTPLNSGNPYSNNPSQAGFGTFGAAHILSLLGEVSNRALKAAWNQKVLHLRVRPEAFCQRVDLTKNGNAADPIDSELLNSSVLIEVQNKWGNYLLPTAYPEGSPTHPSYPSGHATIAGACVTALKAWFDTTGNIPNPMIPNSDGSGLTAFDGPALNIQDELHKLATNIATGRCFAGIHYRSDSDNSGFELGEQVCISVLRDQSLTFNEKFAGFTFQKFDGSQITV